MAPRISPRSRPPWSTVVDRPAALGDLVEELVGAQQLVDLAAVTVAGVSNVNPWLLFAAVRSSSSDSLVALSVPTDRYCGFMLTTVAAPRASIRMSGSRCSHGRGRTPRGRSASPGG